MPQFRIPVATYRLQLNSEFKFIDGQNLVTYLSQLGITDIYSSPIFKSQRGSIHGYDVIDPTQLNPELGTEIEFNSLAREITNHNMGLLLDIVPNHMSTSTENPFWMDVLEKGMRSKYAAFFDIDWVNCGGLTKKQILLPVLGEAYGSSLENQRLSLVMEDEGIFVRFNNNRLPISLKSYLPILTYRMDRLESEKRIDRSEIKTLKQVLGEIEKLPDDREWMQNRDESNFWDVANKKLQDIINHSNEIRDFIKQNLILINGEKGNPQSFNQLDEILNKQVYRLAFWRTGSRELNYRRFFDINTLIGIRVELSEVMESTHKLVFRLVHENKITGLRIDHIDGLYDPAAYLKGLQHNLGRYYVVVEKILSGDELLPGEWLVYGTTGYDFAREVNNVFVDGQGIQKLDDHYSQMIGRVTNFKDVVYEKKKQVIGDLFFSEIHSLGYQLADLAKLDRYGHDLTESDLTQALIEITACLPVYRTYIRSFEVTPVDRQYLELALDEALNRNKNLERFALDFLRRFVLLDIPSGFTHEQKQRWLHLVMRWQQLSGPATAKGLEDTALYTYNRMVSLNIIGAGLEQKEWSVDHFHRFNISRQAHWPVTLNATSTHDTKRGEDVQARINVLSERPRPWINHLSSWRRWNYTKLQLIGGMQVPEPNTEEMLYQSLLGTWPLSGEEIPQYKERFKEYMLKAVREAKAHTSWTSPDEKYEKAVLSFIDNILEESEQNEFLNEFLPFQKEIAFLGILNSLSQVLLKITSPGVPDFYQGTELWNFTLVDPDNRRPVNYDLRRQRLRSLIDNEQQNRIAVVRDILDHWQDGRIKLYLTYKALNFRRMQSELFQSGDYLPLRADGKRQDSVVAFGRRWKDRWAITAVIRFCTRLIQPGNFPLERRTWNKDVLTLPEGAPARWLNVLTGETIDILESGGKIALAEAFKELPVALLTNVD